MEALGIPHGGEVCKLGYWDLLVAMPDSGLPLQHRCPAKAVVGHLLMERKNWTGSKACSFQEMGKSPRSKHW